MKKFDMIEIPFKVSLINNESW